MTEELVDDIADRGAGSPAPVRSRLWGPDFICFGAQKGGTRWLFDQLDAHPDFWMPPIKELHYFNTPSSRKKMAEDLRAAARRLKALNRRREKQQYRPLDKRDLRFLADFLVLADRRINYDRYAALFDYKGERIAGDITPGYSALDDARAAKVVNHFPDARYIFIARDPVKRFWSQICMHVYKERLGGEIDEKAVVDLLSETSYRKRSFQSGIVKRWKGLVAPDRFSLYFFDDLVGDSAGLRRRIVSFLGGDPDKPSGELPPDFNRKAGKSSVPMPEPLKRVISERLAGELRDCAAAFGGPAKAWPALYGL
jgi:Sulfotransferase family